jgi:hypothetical protein
LTSNNSPPPNDSKKPPVIYTRIPVWVRDYGSSGAPDNKAVIDFMICETAEIVRGLQSELIAVSKGNYADEQFDKTVGAKRRVKYGSYQEWAKMMLLWIASYKE